MSYYGSTLVLSVCFPAIIGSLKFMDATRLRLGGILLLLSVHFFLFLLTTGDGKSEEIELKKQRPNAAERAIGITNPTSHWSTIRSWMNQAWLNFRPPDLLANEETPCGTKEVMKDAMKKSFKTSKSTVENSAKSAASIAETAVHKTREKVQESVSRIGREDHTDVDEL